MKNYLKIIVIIAIFLGLLPLAFAENNTCDDLQLSIDNQTHYTLRISYSNNSSRKIYYDHLLIPPYQPQPANLPTVINRNNQPLVFSDMQIYLTEALPNDTLAVIGQSPLMAQVIGIRKYLSFGLNIGPIEAITANCLRGNTYAGYRHIYTFCANSPENTYFTVSNSNLLIKPKKLVLTRFPKKFEIEYELLDKGYCNPDRSKARPGSVKITVREIKAPAANP